MRFLWPAALLLLLLIPVLAVRARRLAPPSLRFPGAAGLRDLPRSLRSRLAFLPRALVLGAL
ncbi:MAG: aerotolerance regulator BatA, partial [Acidobacteria bacterium]|nr:aerotolerance regulator BatA [Acidobacteriota bacterium]